jgi:hypothetical protein
MRWTKYVARAGGGEVRRGFRWGNLRGKRPLGRPRNRWVDTIKMDLQEVGCGSIDWIDLAQVRDRWRTLVTTVMNIWVLYNAATS